MKSRIPIGVVWCSNQRSGRSNGWSFPPAVERLLKTLTDGKRVLHLFGGKADWGVTLDIDSGLRPRVIGDAWLPPFRRDAFDVVIVDPPYKGINHQMKTHLIRGASYVARESVIWFHTMWLPTDSICKLDSAWMVRVGDHCSIRCIQLFAVSADKELPKLDFTRGPALRYNRWLAGQQGFQFEDAARRSRGRSPAPSDDGDE